MIAEQAAHDRALRERRERVARGVHTANAFVLDAIEEFLERYQGEGVADVDVLRSTIDADNADQWAEEVDSEFGDHVVTGAPGLEELIRRDTEKAFADYDADRPLDEFGEILIRILEKRVVLDKDPLARNLLIRPLTGDGAAPPAGETVTVEDLVALEKDLRANYRGHRRTPEQEARLRAVRLETIDGIDLQLVELRARAESSETRDREFERRFGILERAVALEDPRIDELEQADGPLRTRVDVLERRVSGMTFDQAAGVDAELGESRLDAVDERVVRILTRLSDLEDRADPAAIEFRVKLAELDLIRKRLEVREQYDEQFEPLLASLQEAFPFSNVGALLERVANGERRLNALEERPRPPSPKDTRDGRVPDRSGVKG